MIFRGKKMNNILLKYDEYIRIDFVLFYVKYFDFWIFVYKYMYEILFLCEKFVS